MKRLMFSGMMLLVCVAATCYLAAGNTPQINRSDLLPWRINVVRRDLRSGLAFV